MQPAITNSAGPPARLRRELGLENQPVRLMAYRGRIEVLSEKTYEERKREAAQVSSDDLALLEAAGLN